MSHISRNRFDDGQNMFFLDDRANEHAEAAAVPKNGRMATFPLLLLVAVSTSPSATSGAAIGAATGTQLCFQPRNISGIRTFQLSSTQGAGRRDVRNKKLGTKPIKRTMCPNDLLNATYLVRGTHGLYGAINSMWLPCCCVVSSKGEK